MTVPTTASAPTASTPTASGPTRRARYLQLALLVLAAGAIFPMLYLRQVYEGAMLGALSLSPLQLGKLYSLLGVTFMASYLPSGWLADRLSPRWLISFSLLATGALGLCYASLPGFLALQGIFAAFGLTTGLTFWAALVKRVRLLAHDDEQGRFFGALDGGRGIIEALLATIAIALFSWSIEHAGLDEASAFSRVITLYAASCIALGLALGFVKDPPPPSTAARTADTAATPAAQGTLADLRTLLRIRELWLVIAIVFCGYHFFWATYSFSGYLEHTGVGISATMAGVITTIKLWMRPVGGIGGGWLGDRLGSTRVLIAALLLAAAGMATLIAAPGLGSMALLVALVIAIGLVTYAIRALYWAVLAHCDIPARVTGLAIGLISVIGYSPDVFLPLISGALASRYPGLPGYQIYFCYVLAVGLAGVVAARALHRIVQQRCLEQPRSPAS